MKAVCFKEIGKVECIDLPEPVISEPGDAIVKAVCSGLCGSDLHPFHGREKGMDVNAVMGHEMVGEVVEVGSSVSNFKTGDIVYAPFSTNCGHCFYCQNGLPSRCVSGQLFGWVSNGIGLEGCQSEFVRVPLADGTLMKKPDSLSDVSALLLGDNFSTGFFCAEMAEIKPEGAYVVVGCGTVGLLCILAAKSMGAETIIAIDPVAQRREQAAALGAIPATEDSARSIVLDLTAGRGADGVMELVGVPEAQKLAFELIRPGGIMSVIGCHCTPNFAFSPVDAYDKNLTYRTGRCPARKYMQLLTDRVASGEFDIDSFVTHEFDATDCVTAYDVFSNRKDGCLKAVFRF